MTLFCVARFPLGIVG